MNSANELIYIYRKSVKDDEDEKEEEAASHEVHGNGTISSCLDMSIHESCLLLFTFVFLMSSSIVFRFQNLPIACLQATYSETSWTKQMMFWQELSCQRWSLWLIKYLHTCNSRTPLHTHTHSNDTSDKSHTHSNYTHDNNTCIPTISMTTTHAFQLQKQQ